MQQLLKHMCSEVGHISQLANESQDSKLHRTAQVGDRQLKDVRTARHLEAERQPNCIEPKRLDAQNNVGKVQCEGGAAGPESVRPCTAHTSQPQS